MTTSGEQRRSPERGSAETTTIATARQSEAAEVAASAPRVAGDLTGPEAGPLFFAVAGMHGNEPAGVEAIRRVVVEFERMGGPHCGRLLALTGNLGALRQSVRFVDRDLNRAWGDADLARLAAQDPELDAGEDREVRELLVLIRAAIGERRGDLNSQPVVAVDLHTSSAPGEPFLCMGDTLQNRRIASAVPVPVILGIEENIDGALLEYFSSRGHMAIAIEGGQHGGADTVDRLEAALWLAIVAAGLVDVAAVERLPQYHRLLGDACRGLNRWVEVRHRHGTVEGDGFAMNPGWRNFMKVRADEVVARDGTGEIRVERGGLMLLPRYQGQGNDGFFLARRVAPVWLGLSAALRKLGLEPCLTFLPGVSRDPNLSESWRVNRTVARWWAVELFHLFGYRRRRADGGTLVFTRRSEGP